MPIPNRVLLHIKVYRIVPILLVAKHYELLLGRVQTSNRERRYEFPPYRVVPSEAVTLMSRTSTTPSASSIAAPTSDPVLTMPRPEAADLKTSSVGLAQERPTDRKAYFDHPDYHDPSKHAGIVDHEALRVLPAYTVSDGYRFANETRVPDHELLTLKQEQALFHRFNFWRYCAARADTSLQEKNLTADEDSESSGFMTKAADDRRTIAQYNLRLAAKYANQMYFRYGVSNHSMTRDDLFQEAVPVLHNAVDNFNPALGYRFAKYAAGGLHIYLREIALRAVRLDRRAPSFAAEVFANDPKDYRTASEQRQQAIMETLKARVERAYKILPEGKPKAIVGHRYALDGGPALQLAEIESRVGLSHTGVGKVEAAALKELGVTLSGDPELLEVVPDSMSDKMAAWRERQRCDELLQVSSGLLFALVKRAEYPKMSSLIAQFCDESSPLLSESDIRDCVSDLVKLELVSLRTAPRGSTILEPTESARFVLDQLNSHHSRICRERLSNLVRETAEQKSIPLRY